MSVLFKQNKITLPFNDPLRRIQSNVIFYIAFNQDTRLVNRQLKKFGEDLEETPYLEKNKFKTRLNMPPNFSNQIDLLNT